MTKPATNNDFLAIYLWNSRINYLSQPKFKPAILTIQSWWRGLKMRRAYLNLKSSTSYKPIEILNLKPFCHKKLNPVPRSLKSSKTKNRSNSRKQQEKDELEREPKLEENMILNYLKYEEQQESKILWHIFLLWKYKWGHELLRTQEKYLFAP